MTKRQQAVLFVCMGNICRSPTAEAVFRAKLESAGHKDRFLIDSAGTHDYHPGSPPDPRAQAHARRRGYELGHLRARAVTLADFQRFDHIVAMDQRNLAALRQMMSRAVPYQAKLSLLLDHAPRELGATEVPDPYDSGPEAFEHALDLIEAGCAGLLNKLLHEIYPSPAH